MNNKKSSRYPIWELHNYCPICKEKSNISCKCIKSDSSCPNGHHWFVCPCDKNTVIGQSDHRKSSNVCECNSTAYYRTEK